MDNRFASQTVQDPVFTEKAETYERCIEKIRSRFGTNYKIVFRKTVPIGGFLGFFEKDGIELSFIPLQSQTKNFTSSLNQKPFDFAEERKKILDSSPVKPNPQIQQVLDEMRSLKEQIAVSTLGTKQDEHETLTRLESMLEANEFTLSYTKNMLERVRKTFPLQELDDFDRVQDAVIEWIGESIPISYTEYTRKPHVLVLVGPTGVGKTTTVAKFAANFVAPSSHNFTNRRLEVRLITIDNFRIGAAAQLETYANIMDVPVTVASSIDQLKKTLTLYKEGVDVILIDTIGYSPKDYTNIANMRQLLDIQGAATEAFLTVSASTKASDLRGIIQQFEIFGCNSVIVTKFDETSRIGNIISVLAEKNKSIAYITTGQRVPNDIERASVVKFLIQLADFKVNRAKIEERFETVKSS